MTKRILVTGASKIGKAGVATIVFKWGQRFDDELVYDYLMQNDLPETKYLEAIHSKGGIVHTPTKKLNNITKLFWVNKIIKDHKYDTIHINTDTAYISAAYIFAAKMGGIKRIYVHSHCTNIDDNNRFKRFIKIVLHKLFIPYVLMNSSMYLACSELAGKWMFGKKMVLSKKFAVICNGVDINDYAFNMNIRENYRKLFSIENDFVIGNIGRFSYQKNHIYLLEVFSEYHKINSKSKLVLVGSGPLQCEVEKKIRNLNLQSSVLLLGIRDDVPALLSMFDVLVMPSRFEGLPVTAVEAQMASLPCILSGAITREVKFSRNVMFINSWCKEEWVDAIEKSRFICRSDNIEELRKSDFNICIAVKRLSDILTGKCEVQHD